MKTASYTVIELVPSFVDVDSKQNPNSIGGLVCFYLAQFISRAE